jgi:threonine/homoserine/homoserine lactone efflux protein
VGAAYLIWLGIKLWRMPIGAEATDGTMAVPTEQPLRIFLHTYVVTALNPKSIVFFVAFLPQFLDLSRPLFYQMLIFETTFLVLATINAAAYALMASAARKTIRKPKVQAIVNRTGGSLLIGAGLVTAGLRRAGA